MKANARHILKKHYWLMLVICLMGAFIGAEYASSLSALSIRSSENSSDSGVASIHSKTTSDSIQTVLVDILSGRVEEGESYSEHTLEEIKENASNPVLGRTRGVFSMVVNTVSSGSFIVKFYQTVSGLIGSSSLATVLLILLGFLIIVFFSFFIQYSYLVAARRVVLEARTYDKVPAQRFLFLIRVKRWAQTAWNMFVLMIFQFLWSLTVIGLFIKKYSYYMVPYILAENPDMKAREVITLSRRMMNGHKWECFKLDLSFLPWYLLGGLTLGLLDIFYTNPYKTAAFGEYYAYIREDAIAKQVRGYENLNDTYLFEKADEAALKEAYSDIISQIGMPEEKEPYRKGFLGFLSRWFGIVLVNSKKETAYELARAQQVKLKKWTDVLAGEMYPGRLFPIPESEKREDIGTLRYARNYSIPSLIMLYFSFSFIGWLWEVSLHLISDGVFVNRGVLHGPWLPIYGTGGILILIILKRLRDKPLWEFLAAVILCGNVEYFTAYYLEMTHGGTKWWDYTGYFLNLNGRICAEGLLVFGLGGIAIVYAAAPLLDNLFRKINNRILIPISLALVIIFGCDQVYSSKHPNTGEGITNYSAMQSRNDTGTMNMKV